MSATRYETEIVRAARTIAKLQNRRRILRAEIRRIDAELRHERKVMRKLITARQTPWNETAPASKVFAAKAGGAR